jgi:pimeloyl-ACP methyl ester carboxylesterase
MTASGSFQFNLDRIFIRGHLFKIYNVNMEQIQPTVQEQNIGDAEVQYLLYPGDGPPLVLLHATGFLPWLWHPIAQALSSKYRVIAPYFCDHRASEPEEGGLSWMVLAQDLARLCEKLFLDKPFMVGHSMGATVTAIAHGTQNLKIERMVLIEPIFLPQAIYATGLNVEQHPLASRSIKRRSTWDSESEARSYLMSKKMFEKWDKEMLDLYIRYGMISGNGGGLALACHPRHEAALFMGGMRFNPWPILSKIQCPTLVVEGEASENQSFIDLPKITSLIPGGRYRMVEGAGHLIPQEQPGVIAQIIDDFFS